MTAAEALGLLRRGKWDLLTAGIASVRRVQRRGGGGVKGRDEGRISGIAENVCRRVTGANLLECLSLLLHSLAFPTLR